MSANTTRAGFPYPLGTDRVMDGDNAIAALAKRLDGSDGGTVQSTPYSMAAGQASVALSAATQGQVAVTFPGGRFTQPPRLSLSFVASPAQVSMPRTSGTVSATSFNLVVNASASATFTYIVDWVAVQMTTGNSSG